MSSRTLAYSLTAHQRAQAVDSFRTRVVWLAFGRLFFMWAVGWLTLWGAFILVWRVLHLAETALWWGLLGVVPAVVGAAVAASRLAPEAGSVMALLDARSEARGLMLLEEERGDLGAWSARIPAPPELRLTWRPGKGVGAALLSAAFVAATFFVPVPGKAPPLYKLSVEGPVKQLKAQVAALQELGLLEESAAEAFKERINKLEGSAQGESPAKTWEALDHLASQMQAAAAEARQEADKDARAADAAANLAGALAAHGDELSPEQLAAARQAQAALEDRAFAEAIDGGLPNVKPPAGLRMPPGMTGQMPPAQRAAMRQFLRQNREQLNQMNRRLAQAQLGGGNPPGRRPLTPEEMKQLMDRLKNDGSNGGQGRWQPGDPNGPLGDLLNTMDGEGRTDGPPGGKGGGRGPSNGLTWKDPAAEEGANFTPQALPPGRPGLGDSVKVGESATAPQADPKAASSGGGGVAVQSAGGGSAARQNVLPRYRQAVDNYFERK